MQILALLPLLDPSTLTTAGQAASATWAWPTAPVTVVAGFDPPSQRWLAGHRGIDLAARPGQRVTAVADGTVHFVGQVGGVWSVSIDHGTIRSTYQPVRADVAVGDRVVAGEVIGRVASGPWHCPAPCLHLGARVGTEYADPRRLLGQRRIVLKPTGPGVTRPADVPAPPSP